MTALLAMLVAFRLLDLNGPIAEPLETHDDFGECWAGVELSYTFVIRNVGNAPLMLYCVRPSAGAASCGQSIAPGADGKRPVLLNTKYFNGPFTKCVSVSTNDVANSFLRLYLTGIAIQHVAIDPTSAAFGPIQKDDVLSKTLKITNNTDQPLELALDRIESGRFRAELREIIPGWSFELVVTGHPPYELGLDRGAFSLTTNLPPLRTNICP